MFGKLFTKLTKVLTGRQVVNIVISLISLFIIVFVLRMVGLYEGMENEEKEEGMENEDKEEGMENEEEEEEGMENEEEEEGMEEGMTNKYAPADSLYDGKLGKKAVPQATL